MFTLTVYIVMFISNFNHVRLSLDNKRLLTYLLTLLAVGGDRGVECPSVDSGGFHISGVASGRPGCGVGFRGDDGCTASLGLSVDTDFTATVRQDS